MVEVTGMVLGASHNRDHTQEHQREKSYQNNLEHGGMVLPNHKKSM